MSGTDEFAEAVDWFTQSSETDKGRVIEAIESGEELIPPESLAHLRVIISRIQQDFSERGEDHAVSTLEDAGVSSAYAQLLVEKTIEKAPPTEVLVDDLNELSDSEFELLVTAAVQQYSQAVDSDINDLEPESTNVSNLMSLIGQPFMEYLRGEGTKDEFKDGFTDAGVSEERASQIVSKYEEYEDITYRRLMFRNVQDILLHEIRDLKDQQRQTQRLLDETLTILEEAARESDT